MSGIYIQDAELPKTCAVCSAELDAENRSELIKGINGKMVIPLCNACADAYVEWLIKDNERRQKNERGKVEIHRAMR